MELLYLRIGLIKVVNSFDTIINVFKRFLNHSMQEFVGLSTNFGCIIVELELVTKLYTKIFMR